MAKANQAQREQLIELRGELKAHRTHAEMIRRELHNFSRNYREISAVMDSIDALIQELDNVIDRGGDLDRYRRRAEVHHQIIASFKKR
jgi:hypothetical protein